MASQSHMTTALLTEHFRQTPLSLLDEIINTVNELVFKAIDRLEEALSNASPEVLGYALPEDATDFDDAAYEATLADLKQKEIDVGIMQLESLLNAIVDKDFDKFEIYTLRNILAVGHQEDVDLARWIRLEHYRDLRIEPNEQQITPEMVQLQRRKRHETGKLNIMLKEEHARNTAIIDQLQSMLGNNEQSPLGFLATSQPSTQQTAQKMGHIVAQLPTIQKCLADLKTSIAQPGSNVHVNEDSGLAKRRRYLDQQALKALELRGVTVDPGFQVMSRKQANKEDVEGIEAVVQALGGAEGVPD